MTEEVDPLAEYDRHLDEAARLLPAWFIPRMMGDNWFFGLTLVTGKTLCVANIMRVRQAADGCLWLDVELLDEVPLDGEQRWPGCIAAPNSRLTASVNAAHIVMALELADT